MRARHCLRDRHVQQTTDLPGPAAVNFILHVAHAIRDSITLAASGVPSHSSRRCFMMYWYMSQIMRCGARVLLPVLALTTSRPRSLALWYADPSLTVALEVAKAFAPCVEYMMMIWPSHSECPSPSPVFSRAL